LYLKIYIGFEFRCLPMVVFRSYMWF